MSQGTRGSTRGSQRRQMSDAATFSPPDTISGTTKYSRQTLSDERHITELPIYKLLRAFSLQQYTRKMKDAGYSDEVYKLAMLQPKQRTALIDQLKPMPGHTAKLEAFFTVIDEIYPR